MPAKQRKNKKKRLGLARATLAKTTRAYAKLGLYTVRVPGWDAAHPALARRRFAMSRKGGNSGYGLDMDANMEHVHVPKSEYDDGYEVQLTTGGSWQWVPLKRYKGVAVLKHAFDDEMVLVRKADVNKKFVGHCIRLQDNAPNAVYLDAASGATSMALYMAPGSAFKTQNLFVPNPDDEGVCERCPASHLARFSPQTFFEFVRDLGANAGATPDPKPGTFHVGYDVCCSFEGNPKCKPALDLELMFAKGLLPDKGGVLWCTFNMRGVDRKGRSSISGKVVRLAKACGYALKPLDKGSYGNVGWWMWETNGRNL